MKVKLDLSKPNCHVCGTRLRRNLTTEKERCVRRGCQVCNIDFNIPYETNVPYATQGNDS